MTAGRGRGSSLWRRRWAIFRANRRGYWSLVVFLLLFGQSLFAEVAGELLTPADLTRSLETDGPLEAGYVNLETAHLLQNEIWGQGFPAPLFVDDFDVEQQRILKEKHLKLQLRKGNQRFEAIQFNFSQQPEARTRAVFQVQINEYQGVESPQLRIEYLE